MKFKKEGMSCPRKDLLGEGMDAGAREARFGEIKETVSVRWSSPASVTGAFQTPSLIGCSFVPGIRATDTKSQALPNPALVVFIKFRMYECNFDASTTFHANTTLYKTPERRR